MIFNREELQKLIKEKGIKSTADLNSFMKDVSKEVIEALYDGEITDHLGHQKNRKAEMFAMDTLKRKSTPGPAESNWKFPETGKEHSNPQS